MISRRLKLIIAYDGTPFAGWQSQSHRNTIQDHVERAFERVLGKMVRVHGAVTAAVSSNQGGAGALASLAAKGKK